MCVFGFPKNDYDSLADAVEHRRVHKTYRRETNSDKFYALRKKP